MTAVKTRKLGDLFRRGKDFDVDDGEGGSVAVWLQKLNPVEAETAARNAGAARARHLLSSKDPQSVEYLSMMSDILDFSREDLIKFLASQEVAKRTEGLEAEFAEEKGWNKDEYLQGLHDAWEEGGLKERFFKQEEEGPDDEAQRCHDEMEKFNTDFAVRLALEEENAEADLATKPDESLRELMAERLFRLQADMAWLVEFRKSELWLGVREVEHHKVRYCQNRVDVDELAAEVTGQLVDAYAELNVSVTQGKDSEPTPPSSDSSASPEAPEMAASSGRKDAEQ